MALEDAENCFPLLAEAEYFSASEMPIETIYLRDNTVVFEDNTACIAWTNRVIGGREPAKRIDIRKHFAHEAVQKDQNGHMRLYKIPTEYQLADLLTKSLQRGQFERNLSSLVASGWV